MIPATLRRCLALLAALFTSALLAIACSSPPFSEPERLVVSASVSDAYPRQGSIVYVYVHVADKQGFPVPDAKVTATAEYKTTTTTHSTRTDQKGNARLAFNIGGATPGRYVPVYVTAEKDGKIGSARTGFTPY